MTSDSSDAPSGSRSSDPPPFDDPAEFGASAGSSSDAMGDAPPSFGSGHSASFEADRGNPSYGSASMMQEMAAMYVREHQTASMLGAFAAGVFVGALLRD
jgi:hypothetical protein